MRPALLRALTLRQPHAAHIVDGSKRIETRPWQTHYRGPLAIHAAARPELLDFPTRAIVAVVDLIDVVPVERLTVSARERSRGDFRPGRYGWMFANVRVLRTPYPITGAQGLWPIGDDVARVIFASLITR